MSACTATVCSGSRTSNSSTFRERALQPERRTRTQRPINRSATSSHPPRRTATRFACATKRASPASWTFVLAEIELTEARIRLARENGDQAEVIGLHKLLVAHRKEERDLIAARVEAGVDAANELNKAVGRLAGAYAEAQPGEGKAAASTSADAATETVSETVHDHSSGGTRSKNASLSELTRRGRRFSSLLFSKGYSVQV